MTRTINMGRMAASIGLAGTAALLASVAPAAAEQKAACVDAMTANTPAAGFGGVGGSGTYRCGGYAQVYLQKSASGSSGWTTVADTGLQTVTSNPQSFTAFKLYAPTGNYYRTKACVTDGAYAECEYSGSFKA